MSFVDKLRKYRDSVENESRSPIVSYDGKSDKCQITQELYRDLMAKGHVAGHYSHLDRAPLLIERLPEPYRTELLQARREGRSINNG